MATTSTLTTHYLTKLSACGESKTVWVFELSGQAATVARYQGSTEDERHVTEGWACLSRKADTFTVEAARDKYRRLLADGFRKGA